MSNGWAHFSTDRKYRYLLGRHIGAPDRRLLFIMLNPATADESHNDPTIRRCISFAERWNFGVMEVANLFAFRTPYVAELRAAKEPIGADNDEWISQALAAADRVILAWGNHGAYKQRSSEITRMVSDMTQPYHLGMNKTGEPKHPLYLPASTIPTPLDTDILTR
jgi:hypothetical protein